MGVLARDAEIAQVIGDGRSGPRGVVGDVRARHPTPRQLVHGLRDARQGMTSAIDDTVEIEQDRVEFLDEQGHDA